MLRVLVIDDDGILRGVLARALEGIYAVDTAEGAASARRYLAERDYDAVLCDVMMPGETGLDLMSSLGAGHAARFVFMTGGVVGAELLDRLQHSGRPILLKPFELGELQRVIADVASGSFSE